MSKNKNASAASNRTRVKNVRGAKKELAAGEMKKVKGGIWLPGNYVVMDPKSIQGK